MKKSITNTFVVILIIIIPLFFYLFNFKLILFDSEFYSEEFEKHSVYDKFQNADKINSQLLGYFNDRKRGNLVDIALFDESEKQHLLDVKNLVNSACFSLEILFFLGLFLFGMLMYSGLKATRFAFIIISGGALTLVLSLVLVLAFGFSFNASFTAFHRLSFEEGTWAFPETSALINLYPAGFFYDFATQLFVNVTLQAVCAVFLGISLWILLFNRSFSKKEKYLNKHLKRIRRK